MVDCAVWAAIMDMRTGEEQVMQITPAVATLLSDGRWRKIVLNGEERHVYHTKFALDTTDGTIRATLSFGVI